VCHLATTGWWFRDVPERYVAGADTRGRLEGRPYPWSQQVIHEISGLTPFCSLLPEMRILRVYPLFQFITHFKMGELFAGDPNELARFWISPPVGRILFDLEGCKPTDLNAVPLGQSCSHSSKDRLDALFRVNFGNSQRVRK
jgi:hypothetical protein